MTVELKKDIAAEFKQSSCSRVVKVLKLLDIPVSTFYGRKVDGERGKPGPKPQELPEELVTFVEIMTKIYDRWGYQKLAVICRRYRKVSNRQVYRILKNAGMLNSKTGNS